MHHFHPEDIINVDRTLQADGSVTERIRERPKLYSTAVPSILPGCPSYLLNHCLGQLDSTANLAQGLILSLEQQAHDDGRFTVHSLQDLITKLSLLPSSNQWVTWYSECTLHIFKSKLHDNILNIAKRLVITENLASWDFAILVKFPFR